MITPSFSPTATERVLPKLSLDFTTASLDSRVTFTRTTDATHPATYTNSSGYITSANNNQPRFDYDPILLTCKGLLIEESRANIFVKSQEFDDALWTKANANIVANSITAPDNTLTADSFIPTTTSGVHAINQSVTVTAAAQTLTVYAKAAGYSWATISLNGSTFVYYNLADGTLGNVAAGYTATISPAGNGWYRCSATFTTTAGTRSVYVNVASANGTFSFAGDGTSGIYIWGAQLEAGAFATSYIPTTSAALTRNADVATMTGTNFSDWFNASQGTFGCSFINEGQDSGHGAVPYSANDGTTNSFMLYRASASTTIRAYSTTNNVVVGTMVYNTIINSALSYNTSTGSGATNAQYVANLTTTNFGNPTLLSFGTGAASTNQFSGWIRKFNFWNQKLTNNEVLAFSK